MNQKTNTHEIKGKILSVIRRKGPSLPVHVAREIESSVLFTSAFLSELVSEKRLKLSNMKVGNSPLYLIPGQESQLEKFSEYLNGKEKQALELLKEKEVLKDREQEPSIRVALRSIRDFAKPFKKEDEIYWRYHAYEEKMPEAKPVKKQEAQEKDLGIFDGEKKPKEKQKSEAEDKKEGKPKKTKSKKKTKRSSSSKTKKEKFFNHVKKYLDDEKINLKDILSMGRNYLVLLIESNSEKKILVAFNKKRINDSDISKASKKAGEHGLPYILLSKGGPLKRIESLREDLKKLDEFRKL